MLGLPFVRVHGESALRFDVPSLKLYFFGSVIWISEAYFFLLVFLLFFIGVMLFTVLYGRIWCGWICPQTILSDFSTRIEKLAAWFSRHRFPRLVVSQALLVIVSGLVAASLIWYFVSPYEIASAIVEGTLGPWTLWSWVFFVVMIYGNLALVRRKFCGAVCPYARFQSAFFDEKTLTIAFDQPRADECLGCEACVRICPAGIDIRKGLQVECVNCAECIDSCSTMMGAVQKKPLVSYVGGGATPKTPRPRVIGLAAALALMSMLFAYQVYVRVPLNFWVLREDPQPFASVTRQGSTINAYSLIVENRSLKPEIYRLSVAGIKDAEMRVPQNPFILPPNTSVRMKVYIMAYRKNLATRITQLRFTLENVASREIRMEQEASFVYPERTDKGWEI